MVIHLWSKLPVSDPETQRRLAIAQSTWGKQEWVEMPIEDATLPRLFKEGSRTLPYIHDLFDAGCAGRVDQDIIVFSNTDIGFCSQACLRIVFALQVNDAGYAFRRDFHHRLLGQPSDDDIARAIDYPGSDVFFFRVHFWRTQKVAMPDMLLGREAWDACLRVLIEETNPTKPLSLPNLIWHEKHGGSGHWESDGNRYRLPGQLYNLALAKPFLIKAGKNPQQFGIR